VGELVDQARRDAPPREIIGGVPFTHSMIISLDVAGHLAPKVESVGGAARS
jgi:hypothetical protein